MLRIETHTITDFQQNARLLIDRSTNESVLIDPGGEADRLLDAVRESGSNLQALVLTHSHIDHCGGVAAFLRGYEGELPLVATNEAMLNHDFAEQQEMLAELVNDLIAVGLVEENPITAAILSNIGDVHSVADMAHVANLSPRQLQRKLKATTGFTPHDLLKVLRIQHSFRQDYLISFADQSHFTHSFKYVTGYTPGKFEKTFDV